MKTRLVLWGTEADERVLVAIALNARENKVDIWTFPEEVATETLYNRLLNEWRLGRDIPFPNVFVQIERPLTLSEPILPESIKVERGDLIQRAQTEWHFVVLSAKLFDSYQEELAFLREKIDNLGEYDRVVWEELKGFWEKVQSQIHDKNLFRDHARKLKDMTNELFSKLKTLRRSYEDEFRNTSRERAKAFFDQLEQIEERIEQDLGLQPLFEELKKLQKKFKDTRLTRDDRSKVWNRLDKAFKQVKEKRYGPGYKKEYSPVDRLQRRYEGLIAAIGKMEKSIGRDKREIEFQDKRIEESEGQLEAQIRQAKLKMIDERIRSKEAKLAEMMKTKEELEARMQAEKQKAQEAQASQEKATAESGSGEKPSGDTSDDQKQTKSEDTGGATSSPEDAREESLAGAIAATVGESLGDVADTVRAVAEVVSDKIAEAFKDEEE